MRRLLSTAAIAAILAAACSPTPAAPTGGTAPGAPPVASVPQKLTIGFPFIPPSLDPHANLTGTARKFDMFETLIIQDDAGQKAEPLLATEWKLTDATTWRFALRKDAKFHDGTPLTSADVVFSYKRALSPAMKSPTIGTIGTIEDIVAVDAATVDVKTKQPDPLLPKRMGQLAILPKAYTERVGDAEFALKPVGSGPFKFQEFKPNDRIIVTGWMEHAYRKPTLTEVTIREVPDGNARVAGMKTGDLDMGFQIAVDQAAGLIRDGIPVQNQSTAVVGALLDTWGADGTNVGPIGNKQVRQAINYAIDREALAKSTYQGSTKPAGLVVAEGSFGYNSDVKPYTYDQKKAKELLAAAGYPTGFKVAGEFYNNSAEAKSNALFIQSSLKEVGIEMEIAEVEAATFLDKIYKKKPIAPIFMGALNTDPLMDAESALNWFWSANTVFGKRYNNAAYDQLFVASQREMDPVKRESLLKQALVLLQEDPPWLGLVGGPRNAAVSSKLKGANVRFDFWPVFDRISRIA